MRRPQQVCLALLIMLLIASIPTAVALAQLPQFPNTFYGEVRDNNGQPAPVGVVVTAVVDRGVVGSEKRYDLPVTEPGKFGAPNGLKLKVGGDQQGEIADGSTIQFFLSVGALPDVLNGSETVVAQAPFLDDGNPHVIKLDLTGTILDTPSTPSDTTAPSTSGNNNDDNGSTPIPTSTSQPATPTSAPESGGGGQPAPTATPESVPTAEPQEPTPIVVVVAPPQVPTPTEVPTPTQPQPTPTSVPPTPTVSLEIDEPITGGGGEEGGFPWWGWVLLVLGAGAAASGVAIYYLRT